jgi:hypothetical protein
MVERDDEGQRICSRQPPEWCSGSRIVDQGDGTFRREPGLTYRAFCDPCRDRIRTCLDEFPTAYLRLAASLGDPPKVGAGNVRSPFGPSEPVRAEVDALMRTIAAVLAGWEARVRAVAHLTPRNPGRDLLAPGSVAGAAVTLHGHVDALIALQPGWTSRVFTYPPGRTRSVPVPTSVCRRCKLRISYSVQSGLWRAADPDACSLGCEHEPSSIVIPDRPILPAELDAVIGGIEMINGGDGWVKVPQLLSGAEAGNEILDLHHRARKILGETRPQPESFDGIPCRSCNAMGSLERAEPPSDPRLPAKMSRCDSCGDTMDAKEFREWAAWYARWAEGAGLPSCRRCQNGDHEQCAWQACTCDRAEHPRRRAAA